MGAVKHIALGSVGMLMVSAFGTAAFIYSGLYDIGADDHHTKPVLAIIETLREGIDYKGMIERRAAPVPRPGLD